MQDPKYRLHKATGQAVATFNGRDVYLGKHGSKESEGYYNQLLAEFKERGAVTAISKKVKDEGPSYRLHKASGQAVVCLGGRDYYLGEYGSAKSKAEFYGRKSEYFASGCSSTCVAPVEELTIAQLIVGYVRQFSGFQCKALEPMSNVRPLQKIFLENSSNQLRLDTRTVVCSNELQNEQALR